MIGNYNFQSPYIVLVFKRCKSTNIFRYSHKKFSIKLQSNKQTPVIVFIMLRKCFCFGSQ